MQGVQAICGHRPDPSQDFFRRRQGGTTGAINDADQVQRFIFGIRLKEAPALAQIAQTDDGGAVAVLGAVGAGQNADAGNKLPFLVLRFSFLVINSKIRRKTYQIT